MKKLTFKFRNAEFFVEISGKDIWYVDKYRRTNMVQSMTTSELAEYDKAKSEEDLVNICKRDCIKKGFVFVKEENL